ncbi:MAG: ATP-dependent DNA helicase RecG [Gemmatimonadetes bacterium]|nr:ATP-dependent DNA helicase RecG [Gemmatimonadota bacterium]
MGGTRRRDGTWKSDGQPRITLETPVTYLKGVGPARATAFERLGVRTAGDLLLHVPTRYEDASTIRTIASLEPGMDGTILGKVISKGVLPTRKGLRIFQAVLKDATGMIEVAWPGQPFLDRTIEKGDMLLAAGTVRFYHGRQLTPREWVNLGDNPEGLGGRVLPVYPATEGLSFKLIRGLIEQHLGPLAPLVKDPLPESVRAEAGLMPLAEALMLVHAPPTMADAMRGRDRLAFDELFAVQLLQRRARALAKAPRTGIAFRKPGALAKALKAALPYELTAAQKRAIREIVADMMAPEKMHRLLQGDVGAGKTVVAVFAALVAIESGYQAALMAPTELLAEQHHRSVSALLAPLGIAPVLVTGSLGAAARREVATRLASVEPVLAIGTHALVQEGTRFAKLGLAIVDEQHRFGVAQRAELGAKGDAPDVLLMTATPIPRSLALTLHGDLDVSVLDERPPGRTPITTAVRPESARARVFEFVTRQVAAGRQAYIVYPVIEQSARSELKAATAMFEALVAGPLQGVRTALLHGRLPGAERDQVMRAFRDGQLDVLVATTVIEVGIDVPNATVMVVEHPERFGLSQLHQLRGRVGRGAEQSYCILLGDVGEGAAGRLSLFAATEDGFRIAEADLQLRGMGDLFGERQHGVPTYRVADPLRDFELAKRARAAADRTLAADPTLSQPAHAALRAMLGARYETALTLFRTG